MMECDVAILGDGVAGKVARLVLGQQAPQLRVVTLGPAVKPCALPRIGEQLSSSAEPILKSLALWPSFSQQDYIEVNTAFSVWGSALLQERHRLGTQSVGGWSLDRRHFEAWLDNEVNDKTAVRRINTTARKLVFAADKVLIELGAQGTLKAGFVIDATGRRAAVASRQTSRSKLDRLIGAYNYFRQVDDGVEPTTGPLIEAQPEGWLYSALLPQRRMVVCWFTDIDLLPKRLDKTQRARDWRERLLASDFTRRRLTSAGYDIHRPEFSIGFHAEASTQVNRAVFGTRWLAVGDAALAVDPLSSHGIVTALWSGKVGAEAVIAALRGNRDLMTSYGADLQRGIEQYVQDRRRYYGAEARFSDQVFWLRRHAGESLGGAAAH